MTFKYEMVIKIYLPSNLCDSSDSSNSSESSEKKKNHKMFDHFFTKKKFHQKTWQLKLSQNSKTIFFKISNCDETQNVMKL